MRCVVWPWPAGPHARVETNGTHATLCLTHVHHARRFETECSIPWLYQLHRLVMSEGKRTLASLPCCTRCQGELIPSLSHVRRHASPTRQRHRLRQCHIPLPLYLPVNPLRLGLNASLMRGHACAYTVQARPGRHCGHGMVPRSGYGVRQLLVRSPCAVRHLLSLLATILMQHYWRTAGRGRR